MKRKIVFLILLIVLITGVVLFEIFLSRDTQEEIPKTENQISGEIGQASLVEKYVRDNIKTIAINKPVLGGTWYVVSIFVLDELKSGIVVYEDGHIQSTAFFEYEIENDTQNIIIKNFEVN